jgi:predicted nucleotidyltransferase
MLLSIYRAGQKGTLSHYEKPSRKRLILRMLDWAKGYGQNEAMDRDQVIATLREHEPELKAAGILRLSLFGSTARGDRGLDSDIDLLASFDGTRRISLLDVVGMETSLSEILGCKVESD